MSGINYQCWICPQCFDDKHHNPGDALCERNQKISKSHDKIDRLMALADELKGELEQSRGRVSELVTALQDAVNIIQSDANTEENYGSLCRIGNVLSSSNSDALILRKQAEELDIEAAGFELSGNEVMSGRYVATVLRHAASKRRDEAGQAGGGV
jgi:hypothetical protein